MLIAMAIGLALLGGLFTAFTSNQRSTRMNNALTEIQDSGRFALSTLSAEIQMAGYQGCLNLNDTTAKVIAVDKPTTNLQSSAINASVVTASGTWLPAPPGGYTPPLSPAPIPGTHALSVMYLDGMTAGLTGQMALVSPDPDVPIPIDRDLGLKAGQLALISNCSRGDLFEVSSYGISAGRILVGHDTPANTDRSLSAAYGSPATLSDTRIGRFRANLYFVADSGLRTDSGAVVRSLYQQSWPWDAASNPPVEIVQGVENLRVQLGVRDDDGALRFRLPDDSALDPTRIESVRIGLLISSWENVVDTPSDNTFWLAGQSIAPSSGSTNGIAYTRDRRHRAAFNTVAKVRNRRMSP